MAVIAGLEALNRPCEVEIYSDSKYVVDAFNQHWIDNWIRKGWKRGKNEPVKNIDLWKRLLEAAKPHKMTLIWVKGMTATRRMNDVTNLRQRQRTVRTGSLMKGLQVKAKCDIVLQVQVR